MPHTQTAVRVGVYLDQHRHSAVVLRAKEGRVTFLSLNQTKPERFNGRIAHMPATQCVDVQTCSESSFAEQYTQYLPNYPVLRAIDKYENSGLTVTPIAEHIISVVRKNLQASA